MTRQFFVVWSYAQNQTSSLSKRVAWEVKMRNVFICVIVSFYILSFFTVHFLLEIRRVERCRLIEQSRVDDDGMSTSCALTGSGQILVIAACTVPSL